MLVGSTRSYQDTLPDVLKDRVNRGMVSLISVPFQRQGKTIGFLTMLDSRENFFTQEHLEIAEEVASQLAIALTQARLYEEIEQHAAELEDRVKLRTGELEEKTRELETFTYSVSHDLKAPLRGIDGYSRLLLEDHADALNEEGKTFLTTVRHAAQQMSQLIDDLLAYSRLERRAIQNQVIDPRNIVQAVLSERTAAIEEYGAVVSVNLPFTRVTADADGLAIVLRNLIDNALKFSRNSEPPTIQIGGQVTDKYCIIWVQDNGIGFDMQFHERIFDIFQRLHRVEDYPGTGIGLAMVRKAMERMGGMIRAESKPGEGATFYIEIPR